jgi:S-layer homology domain.
MNNSIARNNKKLYIFVSVIVIVATIFSCQMSAYNKLNGFTIYDTQTTIITTPTTIEISPLKNPAEALQETEYGISLTNNINTISIWQTEPLFKNLKPETQYFIFARARENFAFLSGSLNIIDPFDTKTLANTIGAKKTVTTNVYSIIKSPEDGEYVFNIQTPTGLILKKNNNSTRVRIKYKVFPDGKVIWDSPFKDVTDSDWFFNDVEYVYSNALYQGTYPDMFEPYTPMTKGMFITVIWRKAGYIEPTKPSPFKDVTAEWYYLDSVSWAAEMNLIFPTADGLFNGEDNITREQMILTLYQYALWLRKEIPQTRDPVEFTDIGGVDSYTQQGIQILYRAGIIDSKSETEGIYTIEPASNVTRAEIASILRKFIELLY